jgi:hypothetical protein
MEAPWGNWEHGCSLYDPGPTRRGKRLHWVAAADGWDLRGTGGSSLADLARAEPQRAEEIYNEFDFTDFSAPSSDPITVSYAEAIPEISEGDSTNFRPFVEQRRFANSDYNLLKRFGEVSPPFRTKHREWFLAERRLATIHICFSRQMKKLARSREGTIQIFSRCVHRSSERAERGSRRSQASNRQAYGRRIDEIWRYKTQHAVPNSNRPYSDIAGPESNAALENPGPRAIRHARGSGCPFASQNEYGPACFLASHIR